MAPVWQAAAECDFPQRSRFHQLALKGKAHYKALTRISSLRENGDLSLKYILAQTNYGDRDVEKNKALFQA